MISYQVLKIATFLMICSLGYLIGEHVLVIIFKDQKSRRFFAYTRPVLFIAAVVMLVWLCFNKESFHWNYDIATGEPVDHYSTYGSCLVYTAISLAGSILSGIIYFIKKKKI